MDGKTGSGEAIRPYKPAMKYIAAKLAVMDNGTGSGSRPDLEKWFKMRYTSTAAFAVGILLFFLPFAEIRCNDTVIASNSGIGMATGQEWKMHGFPQYGELTKTTGKEKQKDDRLSGGLRDWPNILTLVALLAGVAGLVISVSASRLRSVITMSAGILAAVMLIAMMIQLNMEIKSPGKTSSDTEGFAQLGSMLVKVSYTPWCYLAIAVFGLAALFGYKHHKQEEQDAIEKVVDFEFQRPPETQDPPEPGNNG